MPSPIALTLAPSRSMFKKRSESQLAALASAKSYLSAVHEADARRRSHGGTPTATPALSLSSSFTGSSEDSVLAETVDDNADGLALPTVPPTSEQVFYTSHLEFGHSANEQHRYTSRHAPGASLHFEETEPPYWVLITTYISYLFLIVLGHVRDFFGKRFYPASYKHLQPSNGYAPLNSDFDSFYSRRLKTRLDDCFSVPVTGVPGRTIMTYDRETTDYNLNFTMTGKKTRGLNISSYNYLGFAQASGGCADAVVESLRRYTLGANGTRLEGGSSDLHVTAEALVARFVGQEDSILSSMGFATNSTIIPGLVSKGCLVISDEFNHASIRFGVRQSGANVRMYKHNDMKELENVLREAISQGQPKTHRPWKKILLIVEGLFSMEGTFVDLPAVLELKKKYKFYLWVDEAHSIGAIGPHGRGVADYFGINPREIDILMGTFTKSFGAAGGYISGSKALMDRLRISAHTGPYAEAMAPCVVAQILSSMASIMGVWTPPTSAKGAPLAIEPPTAHPGPMPASALPSWMDLPLHMRDGSEGRARLRRLAFNSRYLSAGLTKLGFIIYGHADSPVVPLLLFNPGKMAAFHRMMRTRRTPIFVVVVGYPATPLVTSRIRFCVSAAHTKEDIDIVLQACDEIGDALNLKHLSGERWPLKRIMDSAVELVNSAAQ